MRKKPVRPRSHTAFLEVDDLDVAIRYVVTEHVHEDCGGRDYPEDRPARNLHAVR